MADGYLQGGEPVEAINLSANGPLRFALPVCSFSLNVRLAGAIQEPQLNLETVLLEPDEERLCMLWRAALPCDKQALKVEEIDVGLLDLQVG